MQADLRKTTAALGIAALAAVGLVSCGTEQTAHDIQTFPLSGDALTLDVTDVTLRLQAGPAGEVTVERTLTGGATTPGNATLSLSGSTLTLEVACTGLNTACSGEHTVAVPQGVAINLRGSGGAVRTTGLSGPLSAELTGDGSLRVESPTGNVTARTAGGNIAVTDAQSSTVEVAATADASVSLAFAAPPQTVRVSASGNAEVTLPAGPETYLVEGGQGDSIASDPRSARSVVVSAAGGRATVRKG